MTLTSCGPGVLSRLVVAPLFAVAICGAGALGAQRSPGSSPVTAFVDASVVTMRDQRILSGQTVIVRDGRIAAMGPAARVRVPKGAIRIDARGKYLMPGLAEMHAHIPGPDAPDALVQDLMFLYVANGVTTIRGMLGAPNQLRLREQTRTGAVLGPTIFVGAPSLNGTSAPTPDSATQLVRAHKRAGYDFLKLHPGLRRDVYDAIVAAARDAHITFAGHVSEQVGLEHTLASGQSTIDHLDGYVEASAADSVQKKMTAGTPIPLGELTSAFDETRARRWAGMTRDAGVWNVPTIHIWERLFAPEDPEPLTRRDEMKYVPRSMVAGWLRQKTARLRQDQESGVTPEVSRRYLAVRRTVLKALADSGAPLLLGTDSPQVFSVPGFSLHREIAVLAESGLTPWQILTMGTSNVAHYARGDLKLDGNFGTVMPGNRADLLLLDANPLSNAANVARRAGVMVRGRWLPEREIQTRLASIAARQAATEAPAR